jgi:peroxiredoxin family protein
MLKNAIYLLLILTSMLLCTGCGGCSGNKTDNDDLTDVSDDEAAPLILGDNIMSNVIQNISSPVEMANDIKASGVDFNQRILNNPDNVSKYETQYKKALNLGIFSADLGYINIFDKNNIVVSYLIAAKTLADGIRVGQFFDFEALRKAAQNSGNLEKLMEMSISSFNEIDYYLHSQNRSDVSTLIITGAWVEGMYLSAMDYKDVKKKEMADRIAEQKHVVEILEIVLDNYKSQPNFPALVEQIQELNNAYNAIRITKEYGEPRSIDQGGTLLIIQDEISTAHYTEEDINKINDMIIDIRNKMVE